MRRKDLYFQMGYATKIEFRGYSYPFQKQNPRSGVIVHVKEGIISLQKMQGYTHNGGNNGLGSTSVITEVIHSYIA